MYINPITLSNQSTPAEGLIELTAEQEKIYIEYSGFIKIISTDPVEIEPDIEAWEAWNKEHPDQPEQEPRPTDTEVLNILLGVNEE